jgi:cysteine-rich repeat protein
VCVRLGTGGSSGLGTGGAGGASSGACRQTVCGDARKEGSEQCDDGNAFSLDGCSLACTLEPEWACDSPGQPCRPVRCGDGYIDYYLATSGSTRWERCDDGNLDPGDGCDGQCEIEDYWACSGAGPDGCYPLVCGDGYADWLPVGYTAGLTEGYYEACDDGNFIAGDGCSPTCEVEPGWVCPVEQCHAGCSNSQSPRGPCYQL